MIDLHLHTTASDGGSTPEALVDEVRAAGVRTMAVTDHDTVAAIPAVAAAAAAAGIEFLPGIEITAVDDARDVHMLGYFIKPDDAALRELLVEQRADRRRRVLEMADRLAQAGAPVDAAAIVARHGREGGDAVGRPVLASALVAAGFATDIADAFDRYLGEGRPAYVPRRGLSPADVVAHIRRAGGVASLAHPGRLRRDGLIPALVDAGLEAIEVFHPDHDEGDVARYAAMATRLGLLMTGGSDYHGPGTRRAASLGRVGLPAAALADLVAHVRSDSRTGRG